MLMHEAERRQGSPRTERASIRAWMSGNGPRIRQTIVLEVPDNSGREALVGAPDRTSPIAYPSDLEPPHGTIIRSSHIGSTFRAEVELEEPALVVAKVGFHPFWNVTLDGVPVETVFAYPGFLAVPCDVGTHEIEGYFQWPLYARALTWLAPLPLMIAFLRERALKRRRRR
jgi:hypothetical protein